MVAGKAFSAQAGRGESEKIHTIFEILVDGEGYIGHYILKNMVWVD